MKYAWDLKKNEINIQKHGIDFNDSIEMFHFPMLTCIDNRSIIRIISVRKATKYENKSFKEKIGY